MKPRQTVTRRRVVAGVELLVWVLSFAVSDVCRAHDGHDGPEAHNAANEKIKRLTSLLAENPDDPADVAKILAERGYLYLTAVDDYEASLADFERLVQMRPKYEAGRVCRAIARQRMGDLRAALADLDPLCAGGIKNAAAWFARGEVYLDLGDPAKARADLDRALSNHKWPLAHVRRAQARLASEDEAGALEDFDAALAMDPKHIEALVARALLRATRKEPELASQDLSKAAESAPGDVRVHSARARVAWRRGYRAEALPAQGKALELWRAEVSAAKSLHRKATILLEMAKLRRDFDEARRALELVDEALKHAPDRPDLHRLRVLLLDAVGDATEEDRAAARKRLVEVSAVKLPDGVAPLGSR